jgi:L-alanine-DL-glutamate epimerase-like enolase superfamily enzyme
MKINQVDLYEVGIPPIPPIVKYYPKIYDITLCRMQTDEGLVGWGEYQGTKGVHEQTASALVGENPLTLDPFARPDVFTCALLDIAGQVFLWNSRAPLLWPAGTRPAR